ncbi:hypothetical protein CDL15_Pgr007371 [Punica granatum]|uniref:Uncharacterized protein n=1 Tax=Punica granatum TaxID=22663 RepID=A0A218X8S3_PUNGR|nr:hypothetical protein CDL15_Pgr007371 [Punica granatum]
MSWASAIALLCYCYAVAASAPNCALSLAALLRFIYLLAVLPLGLSSILLVLPSAVFLACLCNFKLLLFHSAQALSLSLTELPPTPSKPPPPTEPRYLEAQPVDQDPTRKHVQTIQKRSWLLLAMHSIPGWVILGGLGLELEAQFEEPLLATSLEEFWAC